MPCFIILLVIRGAPKFVMVSFFAIGILFVGFSLWTLYLTDIPQEEFQEDPRFEEDYQNYYQWLAVFGIVLIIIGGVFAGLGRRMSRR